jgi:hypothetical protein
MPLLSLTPLNAKTLKDCFKSTVEYSFVSVAGNAANNTPTQEVKKKIQVLHQVFELEVLLIWRATFEEMCEDKN